MAVCLLFVSLFVFAQTIDRSQYKEIDLFSFLIEGKQQNGVFTVKYKMHLKYSHNIQTRLYFKDNESNFLDLETTQRWPLNRDQAVTVYFTVEHSQFGDWGLGKLDYIETSTTSSVKPWLPYVSNGKTGLHGWYLQDMGNGTYKEVYFE